ncbi:MAG: hypothetical protein M3Y35_17395, partial [Actinomycetota bacterium]|nr:hypothetical protein [Actinomycetota bacterium]
MDQASQDVPIELRVLTGPNLYFPRPAVKLILDATGVLEADPATVVGWQRALGVRNAARSAPRNGTGNVGGTGNAGAGPGTGPPNSIVGMANSPAR